jgi:hypothetical protein
MGWAVAALLILGLLASCEPLNKLCQASREGCLDWSIGNPQSFSQPLKVTGVKRLIQHRMGWERKLDCWGFSREQGLH